MKISKKILASVLCIAALLVCNMIVFSSAFNRNAVTSPPESSDTVQETASAYDIAVKELNIETNMPVTVKSDPAALTVNITINIPQESNHSVSIICMDPNYQKSSEKSDFSDWVNFENNICGMQQIELDANGKANSEFKFNDIKSGLYTLSVGTAAKSYRYKFVMMMGDVNFDGKVNAVDIMSIRKILLGNTVTDEQLAAGDLDGSGELGALDIMKLRKIMLEQN